jgi:hypothetical protein
VDIRDNLSEYDGGGVKLYPYAKELHYSTSGTLSMTIELYDDIETQQYTFGFNVNGNLKEFLDQIYEGKML